MKARLIRIFVPLALVLAPVCCSSAATLLEESLRKVDARGLIPGTEAIPGATNLGYAVNFVDKITDPRTASLGATVLDCEAVWTNGFCAVSMLMTYEKLLSNDKGGECWEGAIYSGQRSESRRDVSTFTKAADGTVTVSKRSCAIHKYALGNTSSVWVFDRLISVLGRGYSRWHLTQVVSAPEPSSPAGTWSMTALADKPWHGVTLAFKYEPTSDYLIREFSEFRTADKELLSRRVNSGIVQCPGLSLAESGYEEDGPYRHEFKVTSLTNYTSSEAIGAKLMPILTRMDAPRPTGTRIDDDLALPPILTAPIGR